MRRLDSKRGRWDAKACARNADAYAREPTVVEVIGTMNSGCAAAIIPILNRAADGPLAMVSPANAYVGLTQQGGSTAPGEPDRYFPTGRRNYVRVIAADNFQGAAATSFSSSVGIRSVYVLHDGGAYGRGIAENFRRSAEHAGLRVLGFERMDAKVPTYAGLMRRVGDTSPDAIFLGGLVENNGGRLIKDKVAVLGPNTRIRLIAPDGFATQRTIAAAGVAAEGMFISSATLPPEGLSGPGHEWVASYQSRFKVELMGPYTAYAAQSALVLLDAIARSDGTRASITGQLFRTNLTGSILGVVRFSPTGDSTALKVQIYTARGGILRAEFRKLTPPPALVKAAA